MKHIVNENGCQDDFLIDSAGIGSWHVGQLPDARMRRHGNAHGYNFNSRARQICREDFNDFDLIIVMVMTCSLGKGCIFSAVPVFAFEGVITFLASAIKPLMNDGALSGLSLIGSVLIFCVGLNLIWGKKVRVANLLPAVLFAAAAGILFPGIF